MVKSQHHYSRYQRFMDALKGQSVDGYCEVHHIVPRSLGGSNDVDNLIRLTARQHFVAHWILSRALGGSASRAFFMMSNFGKYGKVNSTTYAIARQEYAEQVSRQLKGKPSQCPFSEETKQKMREAKLGRSLREETKQKLRIAMLGQHPEGRPLRKNFAGTGFTYDKEKDAFIPPKPFPSWTLVEETCQWDSPIPLPTDGKSYIWNEEILNWVELK